MDVAAARERIPCLCFENDEEVSTFLGGTPLESVEVVPKLSTFEIKKLILKEDAIVAIQHSRGDDLQLLNSIPLNGKSNLDWLSELHEAIPSTIQAQFVAHAQLNVDVPLNLLASHTDVASQIIILLRKIMFTAAVEESFEKPALLEELLTKQLDHISAGAQAIRMAEMTEHTKVRLTTLMTETIADVQILRELKEAEDMREMWNRYLRYYVSDSMEPVVRCGHAEVKYGFHFIGNYRVLVKTPLTHEVYFQSLKAMTDDGLFVAQGPAGTGKTETQKDLANALGLQSFVVGCSDNLSSTVASCYIVGFSKMDKVLLVFDELNRCSAEVMQLITAGARERFDANNRKLCAFTLNPGYAAANQLDYPSLGIKYIVDMTVPLFDRIYEVMLATSGFQRYEALSSVLGSVLSFCSENFPKSKYPFCDFGLRIVKTITVGAGKIIKGNPDEMEWFLPFLYHVLCSPLDVQDCALLKEKISSIGEGSIPEHLEYLDEASTCAVGSESLGNLSAYFRSKLANFVFLAQLRHGLLAVTQEGKETREAVIKTISKCAPLLGINFIVLYFDETTTNEQLFGDDGLFTSILRTNMDSTIPTWIALAGPATLGPDMLENMNTLLDDNKLLVTKSGNRVRLNNHTGIILFDDNANGWSPASVSRVGVVNFAL